MLPGGKNMTLKKIQPSSITFAGTKGGFQDH